jgi:hypothetical protein
MQPTTLLTEGVKRLGLGFVTRRLRRGIEEDQEKKHPKVLKNAIASQRYSNKKRADIKAMTKESIKRYNRDGKYRAGHIPPPALGREPDHLMYMFRKGARSSDPIFSRMSKKWGKWYYDLKQAGRQKGRTRQTDIDEAREKSRLRGEI